MALSWPSVFLAGFPIFFAAGLRMYKLSKERNHSTAVDFYTDRFQSQKLRYSLLTMMLVNQVIYLAAQAFTLKFMLNSIFENDEDWPVLLIFAGILIFEWAGGFTSVALSDAVQGLIITTAYVCLPIIVHKNFLGWTDLEWETFPFQHLYQSPESGTQGAVECVQFHLVGHVSLCHASLGRTDLCRP